MILTAHQPAYLPWLGYFEKIHRADVYVYMDSVQYEARSFISRNKIKTPQGELWLTVPVKSKGHRDGTMTTLEIQNEENWRKKHLASIAQNYKKAPRFAELFPKLEALYAKDHTLLVDLCWDHLQFWFGVLGFERKLVKLSTLPIASHKADLILDACRQLSATTYISGALGRDYLDEARFREAGITLVFQDYKHPTYPQLWGDFLPYMGIVDFAMNGCDANLIWEGQS